MRVSITVVGLSLWEAASGVFAALFVLMLIATGLHEMLKQSERLMLRWKEDST